MPDTYSTRALICSARTAMEQSVRRATRSQERAAESVRKVSEGQQVVGITRVRIAALLRELLDQDHRAVDLAWALGKWSAADLALDRFAAALNGAYHDAFMGGAV